MAAFRSTCVAMWLKAAFKLWVASCWLIPVAWFMMTYPSYVIARILTPAIHKIWLWRLAVSALGAVIMTAWDLAMDPMMVAGGHWVWDESGAYFGIPLQNYWGWWLTAFTTFALYGWITARSKAALPASNFDRWALVAYLITMVGAVLAAWVVETSELALIGLFAMLPWPVAGLLKTE